MVLLGRRSFGVTPWVTTSGDTNPSDTTGFTIRVLVCFYIHAPLTDFNKSNKEETIDTSTINFIYK